MSVISREDAIAKIKDIPYVQEHPNIGLLFEEWLKSLPDADDGWISVEDRSPEIDMSYPHSDSYLVWYGGWDIPAIASYSNVNRFWTDHVTDPYWNVAPFYKVIAWRPLPPDFKPKEDR